MIMAKQGQELNRVRAFRLGRNWSQAELAQRAGISRAAVSAIEIDRLVPSVAAALSLAAAFGCTVEDLFGQGSHGARETAWAWPPGQGQCRYWHASVGARTLRYPVEATAAGVIAHDGTCRDGACRSNSEVAPEATLVMACCDPAAGLLAAEIARTTGFRLLVVPRSSKQALRLLSQGLIHVAGVHLATAGEPEGNVKAAQTALGGGFELLRVARWQEGLCLAPSLAVRSLRSALRSRLRWVGREPGSAARECLDELRARHSPPRLIAHDHRGVAEAVRCGWADVGICLRLASEEAGLGFLSVREEGYDLCYQTSMQHDPRIRALQKAVRSASYRRLVGELPGYDSSEAGSVQAVM
jgi:molybdate-binding protein/DNA-binding XRE family transcriptional regulator